MIEGQARAWADEFADLVAAQSNGPLDAGDLERLAVAAYMVGNDEACEAAWIAAHHGWVERGHVDRAAGCAFRHALELFFRGDSGKATGWVARGGRLLEAHPSDCIEQAWFRILRGLPDLAEGNAEGAYQHFGAAEVVATRFADPDATAFARLGRGYSLILLGRVPEGRVLLDEVMVAVASGEVSPPLVGIVYCQVIALCQAIADIRRASEWTDALARWCDAQPGLVPFRGNCLVHRSEILQLRGAWAAALDAARDASTRLTGPPAWDTLASAYYQLGEIHRLRGEFTDAEEAYRQAGVAGRDPQPGLALLWLAQGRADRALPPIRRALDETADPLSRVRLLPACVEIMLAAGDLDAARAAADELAAISSQLDAPYLDALAAHAAGAVLLSEGDTRSALRLLRDSLRLWNDLATPYEAARVRVLIAIALREARRRFQCKSRIRCGAQRSRTPGIGPRRRVGRGARRGCARSAEPT